MQIQYILSVCLLAVLVATVLIRAAGLRRRGVRALVFGQTDKTDYILIPFILLIFYTVLANAFRLPVWRALVFPFWPVALPGWAGLALCAAAVAGFIMTVRHFGESFRVGIDTDKPGKLVTGGMFSVSRNPIYVFFLLFFAGLFLVHRNAVVLVGWAALALAIHRQILREEKFMAAHYGADYEVYRKKVRRYL